MALSVGFIGVGNMGNPMAGNVLKAGFSMTVFDTNPKAMENLIQAGAKRAASAKEVVDASDVVLTSLPGRAVQPHPRELAAERVAAAARR